MRVNRAEFGSAGGTVVGIIPEPVADNVLRIKEYLAGMGYAALFSTVEGEHVIRFGLSRSARIKASIGPDAGHRPGIRIPAVNLILFLLTLLSTLLVGALQQGGNVLFLRDLAAKTIEQGSYWHYLWQSLATANPLGLKDLVLGIPFSFALLLILGSHELGHFLTARRYGVDATLPFFIPMPFSPLGTMGAFIRIKSPIPNRRALVRLGVAGPLVGFAIAVPVAIVGILLSKPVMSVPSPDQMALGSSLLFEGLSRLLHPHMPAGYELSLHPLAFAGWLGFFVTALNLIPIGQLDGGHVAYVALGRFRIVFRYIVLAALVVLGLFTWPGWFFWAVLVLVLGLGHPPTQDEITPLNRTDRLLMAAALLVFALAFIPNPFPMTGS